MQTFVPLPSFAASALVLDRRRLGKQRVEATQLLMVLLDIPTLNGEKSKGGWQNHPAALMWKGHERALSAYLLVVCKEWQRRGFSDGLGVGASILLGLTSPAAALGSELSSVQRIGRWAADRGPLPSTGHPAWWGDSALHASHRSNLIRKDPIHYGQWGWSEPADLPYVWPTLKSA